MLELTWWLWLVTLGIGVVASTATTVTGIGAGLIVYGVSSLFSDLQAIIPAIALAQLLSNNLRCWVFRHHIRWCLAGYFFLGVRASTAVRWSFTCCLSWPCVACLGCPYWGSPPLNASRFTRCARRRTRPGCLWEAPLLSPTGRPETLAPGNP